MKFEIQNSKEIKWFSKKERILHEIVAISYALSFKSFMYEEKKTYLTLRVIVSLAHQWLTMSIDIKSAHIKCSIIKINTTAANQTETEIEGKKKFVSWIKKTKFLQCKKKKQQEQIAVWFYLTYFIDRCLKIFTSGITNCIFCMR